MLEGFKIFEERDASDNITKKGTVSKHDALTTDDNQGLYDAIAKDFNLLHDAVQEFSSGGGLSAIQSAVEAMYNDMKTNPAWGSTAAKAQAEEALKQAQAAAGSAAQAKEYSDQATELAGQISAVQDCLKTIEALRKDVADNAAVATNQANAAKDSETKAKTSETNAKASENAANGYAQQAEKAAKSINDKTILATTNGLTFKLNAEDFGLDVAIESEA